MPVERLRRLLARYPVRTFAGTLAPTMGALALQLVAFAITARALGVEQFGRYTGLLAVAVIGVDLVGLGATDLLVRGVARRREHFARYFGHTLWMIALTVPAAVLLGSLVCLLAMGLEIAPALVALALAAEILLGRSAGSLEMIMVAHGHPARAGWVRFASALMRLAMAAGFFIAYGGSALEGWIHTVALGALVVVTTTYVVARRLYGAPASWIARDELRAGLSLCFTQMALALQNNMDRMVLSRLGSAADVGAYGAATRVLQLGFFPLQVATRITYPKFFAADKPTLVEGRRFARSLVLPMLGVGLFAALAVAAGALAIPFVLGAQYVEAVPITLVLALALPIIAVQTPPADALVSANLHNVRAAMYGAAAVVLAIALLAGALLAGPMGLAVGFVLTQAALALGLWSALELHVRRLDTVAARG